MSLLVTALARRGLVALVSRAAPRIAVRLRPPVALPRAAAPVLLAGGWAVYFTVRRAHCKSKQSSEYTVALERVQQRAAAGQPPAALRWSHVWRLIRPYIGWLLAAVLTAVAAAVVNVRMPLALGRLVDAIATVHSGGETGALAAVAAAARPVLALYVAQAALTALYIGLVAALGERVACSLRCSLFQALLRQDMSFFDAHRTGELITRVGDDVQQLKSALKACISQGLRTATQICGSAASLYLISPPMTLATVTALPLLVALGTAAGAALRSLSRRAHEQSARAVAAADECLGNMRTVRAFDMETAELRVYADECERSRALHEALGAGIGAFQAGANLALNGLILGVLWAGARLISADQLSPGDLMSFLVTAQTIQRSMQQLSTLFGHTVKGYAAGARVFEFMDRPASMWRPAGVGRTIAQHSLMGDVRFDAVTFAYATRPQHVVLDALDLRVPAGKTVALCGASGSGKSTIASLLERFYDAQSGSVSLDGVDVRQLDQHWLRRTAIGYIAQEPVLFNASIGDNIRYGKPDATQEEIEEAARSAHAHEFIASLPDGYATVVGERGACLSGGQRQRIAIARALVKRPAIVILDEATSALDADSETHVRQALAAATAGRTVLVIAHRLSTVRSADLIAVVDDKRVVEFGTHSELMRRRGAYYKLVSKQDSDELQRAFA